MSLFLLLGTLTQVRNDMFKTAAAVHILVKHKEQAEDIVKQLNNGANFAVLAKRFSSCPSAKKGGDLGEFKKAKWCHSSIKSHFRASYWCHI